MDSGPKKDTRNLKSKEWQAEKGQEMIEFLVANNYNHHVSPKLIMGPTRKEFEEMFKVTLEPESHCLPPLNPDVTLTLLAVPLPFDGPWL